MGNRRMPWKQIKVLDLLCRERDKAPVPSKTSTVPPGYVTSHKIAWDALRNEDISSVTGPLVALRRIGWVRSCRVGSTTCWAATDAGYATWVEYWAPYEYQGPTAAAAPQG